MKVKIIRPQEEKKPEPVGLTWEQMRAEEGVYSLKPGEIAQFLNIKNQHSGHHAVLWMSFGGTALEPAQDSWKDSKFFRVEGCEVTITLSK